MVLDNDSSKERCANIGVSLDFILAPTLFLLYINGLPDVIFTLLNLIGPLGRGNRLS